MAALINKTSRQSGLPSVRRLGVASSIGILSIGIAYLVVIGLWLIIEATPREPIGDPYLALMEILTILSALALLGFVVAVSCFAEAERRVPAIGAVAVGSLAAGLTMAVHFVQLTAARQLWRGGELDDYRLVWPSVPFAVEYFAWDILVGLTLVLVSLAIAGRPGAKSARGALCIAGVLCLLGSSGPLTGRMALQNISVLGYAVVLPVAAALAARMFRAIPSTDASSET